MATLAIVNVLMEAGPNDQVWGYKLCEEADLGSGTVYPLLERLERRGLISSFWESPAPADRPPRRFYEMTSAGRQEVSAALRARADSRRRWLPGATQSGGSA